MESYFCIRGVAQFCMFVLGPCAKFSVFLLCQLKSFVFCSLPCFDIFCVLWQFGNSWNERIICPVQELPYSFHTHYNYQD